MARSLLPPAVPLDLWREALSAAPAFRELAPWQWRMDSAISVHVDAQNSPWFACVLGAAGEVFGLVLYRGEEGFRGLRAVHEAESETALADAPRGSELRTTPRLAASLAVVPQPSARLRAVAPRRG